MQRRRTHRRRGAGRSRRVTLVGLSAALVAGALLVTPHSFAGTLPGFGAVGRQPATGAGSMPGRGGGTAFGGLDTGRRSGGTGNLGGTGNVGGSGNRFGGSAGAAGQQAGAGGQQAGAGGQQGSSCPDVELVFARGTGEPQGLGIVGRPLAAALGADLPNAAVGSFAVVYPAAADQSSAGPGATDMSRHIVSVAQSCPDTKFVIGGYSQGATVADIAMGIPGAGAPGEAIPSGLTDRVAAVVAFGSPLGLQRRTIAQSSPDFGPKAKEFCNAGDPVCGNGANLAAHLAYPRNGSVEQAAQFAAGKITG
jgi:cutinase